MKVSFPLIFAAAVWGSDSLQHMIAHAMPPQPSFRRFSLNNFKRGLNMFEPDTSDDLGPDCFQFRNSLANAPHSLLTRSPMRDKQKP